MPAQLISIPEMYLTEKQYREMLAQLVRIPEMYIYQLKPLRRLRTGAPRVQMDHRRCSRGGVVAVRNGGDRRRPHVRLRGLLPYRHHRARAPGHARAVGSASRATIQIYAALYYCAPTCTSLDPP